MTIESLLNNRVLGIILLAGITLMPILFLSLVLFSCW